MTATPSPSPGSAAPPPGTPAVGQTADARRAGRPTTETGRHAAEPSIGQLVSDASTQISTLIQSEIQLAKLELRSTVKNAGTGIGFFLGAAVVLVFSLVYGFIAAAEGIAVVLPRWLAFLIVFALQLVVVGLFVLLGIRKIKRVKAPEATIRTTKETVGYLKNARG